MDDTPESAVDVSVDDMRSLDGPSPAVDPAAARFPYCVVWSPIPVITWIIPFVGHLGICTSEGIILDFAGPYYISVDRFSFGRATRYMAFPPHRAKGLPAPTDGCGPRLSQQWDHTLQHSAEVYRGSMYNFCTNNCHEFVAHFLNSVLYDGSQGWNMITLAARMLFLGRFVSFAAMLWTWLPFAIIATVAGYFGGLVFLIVYSSVVVSLVAWFLLYTYVIKRMLTSNSRHV